MSDTEENSEVVLASPSPGVRRSLPPPTPFIPLGIMPTNPKEMQIKLQATLDHLKQQAAMPKTPLSITLRELVDYCKTNQGTDYLITPLRAEDNPFREKSRCTLV